MEKTASNLSILVAIFEYRVLSNIILIFKMRVTVILLNSILLNFSYFQIYDITCLVRIIHIAVRYIAFSTFRSSEAFYTFVYISRLLCNALKRALFISYKNHIPYKFLRDIAIHFLFNINLQNICNNATLTISAIYELLHALLLLYKRYII